MRSLADAPVTHDQGVAAPFRAQDVADDLWILREVRAVDAVVTGEGRVFGQRESMGWENCGCSGRQKSTKALRQSLQIPSPHGNLFKVWEDSWVPGDFGYSNSRRFTDTEEERAWKARHRN